MKLRTLMMALVLTLSLPLIAKDKTTSKQQKPREENSVYRQKILHTLISNSSLPLVNKDGSPFVGCEDPTLGEYLAVLISNAGFSVKGSKSSLNLKCGDYDKTVDHLLPLMVDNGNYKFCELEARVEDRASKDPWHYSLLFAISKKTGEMAKDRIACPGGS